MIKEKLKQINWLKETKKIFLVILGTCIVAFGSSIFLVPFHIVAGGVAGLGIIFNVLTTIPADIIILIFTWGLFFLGLIFLGFKFTLSTLISTIIYPMVTSLTLRSGISCDMVNLFIGQEVASIVDGVILIGDPSVLEVGHLLIAGLLGALCVGTGCALTFLGGGSTGGVDILAFILNKFLGLRTSIATFLIDGSIIVASIIMNLVQKNSVGFQASLIGLLSSLLTSMMVEIIYVHQSGAFYVDVITDNVDTLKERIFKEVDRSVTIYNVTGGYSEEEKICVRIICRKDELIKVKNIIADIDKMAFVVTGECSAVNGLGFTPIKNSKDNVFKRLKNKKKKDKDDK